MQSIKFACPHCQAILRSPRPLPEGARVKCVTCHKPFTVQAAMQKQSTRASYDGGIKLPIETFESLTPAALGGDPAMPPPLVSFRRRQRGMGGTGVLFVVLFLLLAGGAGAAVFLFWQEHAPSAEQGKKTSHSTQAAVARTNPTPVATVPDSEPRSCRNKKTEPARLACDKKPAPAGLQTTRPAGEMPDPVMPRKKEKKAPPLDQAKVEDAIERGVKYLKDRIDPSGTWKPEEKLNPVGHAALPALALLECKVPAGDPAIQAAARYVRRHIPTLDETYDIGCALLFLDRLDDPADRLLLRSLAMRLAAGQNSTGTWGYQCPRLSLQEGDQLLTFLEQHRPRLDLLMAIAVDPKEAPKSPPQRDDTPHPPQKKSGPTPQPRQMSAKLAELPVVKYQKAPDPEEFQLTRGDNSNTQFALLGLWVARRHGIAVEPALDFAAKHFQKTQNGDGGWGYVTGNPTKNTMTCVGLLGLAMGHGAAAEAFQEASTRNGKPPRPPINDPAIKDALESLVKYLDGGDKEIRGLESRIDLYFLWALERVGVLYQRDTFGKTDWYRWGAREILSRQEADGRWEVHYHPAVDTSFALLFLQRSNLVRNLTQNLRAYLAIADPGER